MASAKEIRTQIKSIQNTRKITKAMEMVAASKMRRAQERMSSSRPYADKMKNVIGHLAHSHPEYKHPFMIEREEVKRVGYIVVSSDRGLCGGLNVNLFRELLKDIRSQQSEGKEVDVSCIGQKGVLFFKRVKANMVASITHLGDTPHLKDILGVVTVMLEAYERGEVDQIKIVYNRFVNTMTQKPQVEQLVPIKADETDEKISHHWDYIYEPEASDVLNHLLTRYVESLVYQGVVENMACEMAARMIAMKSATDNAGNLINELKLDYNKARQAAITQELSEIVAGAAAV